MKVLNVMLSEEAQNRIVADGQDVLSYSQNVPLRLTEYMKDVRDVVEENHMYIRIASNDFFCHLSGCGLQNDCGRVHGKTGLPGVQRPASCRKRSPLRTRTVLTSEKSYSNVFHANGGNTAFFPLWQTRCAAFMARMCCLATANSLTGSVLKADLYPQKMVEFHDHA